MNRQEFDIIIVGAGIAGSALAVALRYSSLRVALVEGQALTTGWPELNETVAGYDHRVSALTATSQRFLQQLGAWDIIAARRLSAYQQMHVWDGDGTGSIHFDADEINEPCLGHIIENRETVAALQQLLRQASNIQLLDNSKLTDLGQEGGLRLIELEDGRQLAAPLLVAADGALSLLRDKAGFQLREWAYGHNGIVATVRTELPHQATAWQRFMPEGILAFLPLSTKAGEQQLCSIVWSVETEQAEALMALDEWAFAERLQSAFEARLGKIEQVGPRYSFPLRQRHAVDYVQPGIALVADAAHTIHPLAGQGINIGLKDVAVLAEEILRAEQRAIQLSDPSLLKRYQRRRKADNLSMMATMEAFKRLFAQTALPVRWLRNTGMRWLDQAAGLKRRIVRQAMGL